jgi:hypothetical protein
MVKVVSPGVLAVLGVAFILMVFIVIMPCYALGSGKVRGDYPRCQQECLAELDKEMAQASDSFSKDKNSFSYEERVEEVNRKYNQCLSNCKKPMPVK